MLGVLTVFRQVVSDPEGDDMTQQHIGSQADAEAMFGRWDGYSVTQRRREHEDGWWARPLWMPLWMPPLITHLPGPIACQRCEGEPCDRYVNPGEICDYCCPDCNGLGYPPELEIVSYSDDHGDNGPCDFPLHHESHQTVHGVVKLGPPERHATIRTAATGRREFSPVDDAYYPITPKETT
jgi:hypothetical protein